MACEITNLDIEQVAEAFGLVLDEARRAVLAYMSSCDVQAVPGSGKTTLLVAKLAILARKWASSSGGICVLSHTNVAHEEVIRRLGRHDYGQRLLNYPHFIGTIQSFVDRFLAMPAIRSKGLEIKAIDNDMSSRAMLRRIPRNALFYLEKRHQIHLAAELSYLGPDLSLSAKQKLPASTTPTYQSISNTKDEVCRQGIFRFEDMYAFAEGYVRQHPWVIEAAHHRFPWIFIDEMQDTNSVQEQLLNMLFAEGCTLQRFGDCNQAIFSGETDAGSQTFPRDGHLTLPTSMRFGQAIASLASPLTAAGVQQEIIGNPDVASRRHTIFLFKPQDILKVLPAFGDLILQECSVRGTSLFSARAIGFRKEAGDSSDLKKVPFSIGQYCSEFDAAMATQSRPQSLVASMRKGRYLISQTLECGEAFNLLCAGVLEFLDVAGANDSMEEPFSHRRLIAALTNAGGSEAFRELLSGCLLAASEMTEDKWGVLVAALLNILQPWLPEHIPVPAMTFLAWEPDLSMQDDAPGARRTNTYRHCTNTGEVEIELSTIHGAKGQTHTATLVLETYLQKKFDLQSVLPFLLGQAVPLKASLREHMKRVFVAMTRPRELLCLAIREDHVSADACDLLTENGWTISRISS